MDRLTRRSLLASHLDLDFQRWKPLESIRFAAGVAIPVVVSIFTHHPGAGVLASLGALYTGLAATSGVYQTRLRTAAVSGLFIGLATALGTAVGREPTMALISVLSVAFLTALYAAGSQIGGTISAQATATLCVLVGLQLPPSGFILNGLLVFGGSFVQLVMFTILWPMKPIRPEATAVAEAYADLAGFVINLTKERHDHHVLIPSSQRIQEARTLMSDAEKFTQYKEHERLLEALRHAEAIRAALVGFAEANRSFRELDRLSEVRAQRILRSLARSLAKIGELAKSGKLGEERVRVRIPSFEVGSEAEREYLYWLGILADLVENSCGTNRELPLDSAAIEPLLVRSKGLLRALTRLPSARSLRAITLNHALRYGVVVGTAFAISQHWTRSHSFWLPLTAALVLRQNYGATFNRGVARMIGTLVGLVCSIAIVDLIHPPAVVLQGLTVAMAWIAFASIQASYTAMTIAVTGYVVFGIAVSGSAMGEIGSMRLVASLLGCLLAVVSYVFWPAWNWREVWGALQSAAVAQADYVRRVLSLSGDLSISQRELDDARAFARSLRIQSEKLVEAVKMHPFGRNRANLSRAESTLLALEENAAIILVAQTAWNNGKVEYRDSLQKALDRATSLMEL